MAHSNVMRHAIEGCPTPVALPRSHTGTLPPRASRAKESCCSDADRNTPIVASLRGRANWGLQDSSRLSRFILKLNLGVRDVRDVVVGVEVVVDVELLSEVVVVASHMIIVKIELVGCRDDPVVKELRIVDRGCRKAEEVVVIMVTKINITESERLVVSIQGRCSSD
jgi:hypothetical protein